MKILSPLPRRRARIEIIPLIDIMFFLLAAFMLASLTLMRVQAMKLNLPRAAASATEVRRDTLHIAVDRAGDIAVAGRTLNLLELRALLADEFRRQPDVPVSINGDREAAHGRILQVLEAARNAGFERVQFGVLPPESSAVR
ncbi:MAG: ExbD/TolR family protein [Limisphaerales bacterium]